MGHRITKEGIFPDEAKVNAVKQMPTPNDKKDIQRFLGLINYMGRFIPNLAEHSSPLRAMLRKEVVFVWGDEQQRSFDCLKKIIVSDQCLAKYDVTKPVCIEVDACNTGLGAVLLQEDRPVAYASRSMTAKLCYHRKRTARCGICM